MAIKMESVITGYKTCKWYNRRRKEIFWGVDVQLNGKKKWYHLVDDNGIEQYKTEHEACQQIKKYCKEDGTIPPPTRKGNK